MQPLFVVAGPQSSWSRRRKLTLSELVDAPWILSTLEAESGSPFVEAFRADGDFHPEGPNAEPGGASVCRLRSRRRQAACPKQRGALTRPIGSTSSDLAVACGGWSHAAVSLEFVLL
ncbi:hypothetical protein ACFFWD_05015 [Bradyrhizobium erythrophlei]|uniref:hypothetical protein n=1 Tax=Bradyrhizobium erythrophlei TaxID=1437360 RepID=UPI0035E68A62